MKKCNVCFRELPFSHFHKFKEGKFGLQSKCKDCVREYRREYYKKNKERLIEYSRQFYNENSEHLKKRVKIYAKQNVDKIKERSRKYREQNRETLLIKKREDYLKNRERYRRRQAEYRKKHPEYNKISTHKRRARLKKIKGCFSAQQWRDKCRYWGWRCYLCGTELTIKTAVAEHRKPISRGGSNWIANIAPACQDCNLKKGAKTEEEFTKTECL